MLRSWLGPVTLDSFRTDYFQRAPLAQPGTASPEVLDWDLLGRVLAATAPPPDVLVVTGGKLLGLPAPTCLTEMRAYLRMGIGLGMRHTERCDPALRRIADDLEAELDAEPGSAQVQIFVTPGGTHGFGWHYDDEDVFIAQTVGSKDYYFRANTVAAEVTAHGSVFGRFVDETSPLCSSTLIAGDFLYVPSRWWHMAVCREDALSISIGVMPRRVGANLASSPGA